MKKIIFLSFSLFILHPISGQRTNTTNLGHISLEELKMNFYKKDSSASALVLYEHCNFYLSDYTKGKFTTDHYYKIKILTNDGLDRGTHSFVLYEDDELNEVSAVSYNLGKDSVIQKTYFNKKDLLKNKVNEQFEEIIINIPDVRVGSVLEIKYSVSSESAAVNDWYFQSDIPKVKSEISISAPRAIPYKAWLRGTLDAKTFYEKGKRCFPNERKAGICDYTTYSMDSIPKFEKELLMPDPISYISTLKFRLLNIYWWQFDLSAQAYYSKNEKNKRNYINKILPDSIKEEKNKLLAAKKIYSFIQNYYTWDGYKGGDTWLKSKYKKKLKEKSGSLDLISSSLYNGLKSAGIEAYYTVLSTKGHGIPEKSYPNIRDYNYTVVKAVIDDKEYFLDPTDKNLPFGNISPVALNGEARVLNFDKGSYWQRIIPLKKAVKRTIVKLNVSQDGEITGEMNLIKGGYLAHSVRTDYNEWGEAKYKQELEQSMTNIVFDDYSIQRLKDLEKPTSENIVFTIDDINKEEIVGRENTIRFNPILFEQLTANPFTSDERKFPLDFVFPFTNIYTVTIDFPEDYKVKSIPSDYEMTLPNGGGYYLLRVQSKKNQITVFAKLNMINTIYSKEDYFQLQELFSNILKVEKLPIELEKK